MVVLVGLPRHGELDVALELTSRVAELTLNLTTPMACPASGGKRRETDMTTNPPTSRISQPSRRQDQQRESGRVGQLFGSITSDLA